MQPEMIVSFGVVTSAASWSHKTGSDKLIIAACNAK
jgi:hypothetical protein